MGLTTQGQPTTPSAARNSARSDANAYGDVLTPSCSAASRRMPSRSIVRRVARAVGMTQNPSASSSTSAGVAIASSSGTMKSGSSARMTRFSSAASVMAMTCERWATCIAGAFA